jgi:hypothetical protein
LWRTIGTCPVGACCWPTDEQHKSVLLRAAAGSPEPERAPLIALSILAAILFEYGRTA